MPREAFAKPWTARTVLLLGLGDSVTAGYGVAPPYSYFNRLAKNPDNEFADMQGICLSTVLPNLRTKNMAVSDSTSLMHLDTIRDVLKTQDSAVFGLVVMTTGGNDLMHYYGRSPPCEVAMYGAALEQARPWIENFEKRLDEMINLLEARFPGGCMIFLADIYDPSDGVGDPASILMPDWTNCMAIHREYNDVIHRYADRYSSVHVVPIHEEFWARHSLYAAVAEALSRPRSALLVRREPCRSQHPRLRRHPPIVFDRDRQTGGPIS